MLTSLPAALLIAALCGILSALGLGGGSLLLLWLTAAAGVGPEEARGISLLFFIPAAGVTFWTQYRKNKPLLRRLLPVMAGGCIGAAGAGLLALRLDSSVLKQLFAWYLLYAGLRQLFYRPRKAR